MAQRDHCLDPGKIGPYHYSIPVSAFNTLLEVRDFIWNNAVKKHNLATGVEKQIHLLGTSREVYSRDIVTMYFLVDLPITDDKVRLAFGHRKLKLYQARSDNGVNVALMHGWLARREINSSNNLIAGFYFLAQYFTKEVTI